MQLRLRLAAASLLAPCPTVNGAFQFDSVRHQDHYDVRCHFCCEYSEI